MAFSYRTAVEEGLNRLTSEEQSRVSAPFLLSLSNKERRNHELFSYAMSDEGKKRLSLRGIYLSPHSYFPHSHPICKTLENNILYNVLPSKLDNSFYFIGIKNSKVNFIKGRGSKLDMVDVINRVVTSQDRFRYSNELTVQSVKNVTGFCNHMGGFSRLNLSGYMPSMVSKKEPKFFIHDEIHYWNLEDLRSFLIETKPSVLLATLVFPPELLIGARCSMNPWCYDFEVEGKNLSFFPDGVRSEGYTQPLTSGELLRMNSIDLLNGTSYNVDLVYSSFAHHLICITPAGPLKQIKRHFSDFSAVSIDQLSGLASSKNSCYPVTYELVSKLYLYLRTLKKPDAQSSMAKLRQLVENPSAAEIKFCEEISELIIESDKVDLIFCESMLSRLKFFFASLLPGALRKFCKAYKERALAQFINCLKPLEFSLHLEPGETLQPLEHILQNLWSIWDGDTPDEFIICKTFDVDRPSVPYSIPKGCVPPEGVVGPLHFGLLDCLINIFLPSFVHEGHLSVTEHEIRAIILCKLLKCCGLQTCDIPSNFKALFGSALLKARRGLFNKRKTPFIIGGVHWFFSARRENTRYLTRADFTAFRNNASHSNFSRCMEDISGIVWRNVLKSPFSAASKDAIPKSDPALGEKIASEVDILAFDPTATTFGEEMPECSHTEEIPQAQEEIPQDDELFDEPEVIDPLFQKVVESYISINSLHKGTFELSKEVIPPLFDTFSNGRTVFGSREALFFARCDCITYGHDRVLYKTMPWEGALSALISKDENYYNTCLLQRYKKDGILNYHADDEKCYGDYPIFTVNLTGFALLRIIYKSVKQRADSLSDKMTKQVAVFLLSPGSSFHFPAGFQGLFKHSVVSLSEGRVSLTYRNQVKTTEGCRLVHTCIQGAEFEVLNGCIVKPKPGLEISNFNTFNVPGDGNCFWHSMSVVTGLKVELLMEKMQSEALKKGIARESAIFKQVSGAEWADRDGITFFCATQFVSLIILNKNPELNHEIVPNHASNPQLHFLYLDNEHFSPCIPKNGCVVKALADSLGRKEFEVLSVLGRPENGDVMVDLVDGEGLSLELLEKCFKIFDISAGVNRDEGMINLNPDGKLRFFYELSNDHLMLVKGSKKGHSKVLPALKDLSGLGSLNPSLIEALGSRIPFTPNLERAKTLHDCFLDGLTGKILDSSFSLQSSFIEEFKEPEKPLYLTVILGTFGSGKSTLFSKMVKMRGKKDINFVSPRKALAEQVKDDIIQEKGSKAAQKVKAKRLPNGIRIRTFERAIKERTSMANSIIVLDEIQLYPPGYLDLLVGIMNGCVFVVMGDPCQSDYHSAEDNSVLGALKSDIDLLLDGQSYNYNIVSRRFSAPVFVGRLPCRFAPGSIKNDEDDDYDVIEGMGEMATVDERNYDCILVSSFAEKTMIWAYLGRHIKCLTFGESTGLTFDVGVVAISEESTLCSEKRWLTALSRFRKQIVLLNLMDVAIEDVNQRFYGRALSDFLTKKSSEKVILSMLPGKPLLKAGFGEKVGRDEFVKELKLQGDPWLKTQIFLGQTADMEVPEPLEAFLSDGEFQTHLPLSNLESIRSRWVHKIKAKEVREMRCGVEVSQQFPEEHSKNNGVRLTNAAERYEAIYPRHKGNDSVTFLMAVRKRLKFSNPAKEMAKYRRALPYGKMILMEFLKKVGVKRGCNKAFMEESVREFEEKKTSKPGATIENHSGRSCADWAKEVALIFMKSQHCTKFDNRFRDAKAGQTLACFQHSVLCRFAPYMRYIEKKVNEAMPGNFYIHSGKNLETLDEWVNSWNFTGVCTESDYEAFDASQDHYIMAFEVELMKFLGLPTALILDYIHIKTHLGSKLGNFAIMRFTGEASTFLFNTLANMVFTFMRYDLNGSEAICFAGDDMCAKGRLRLSCRYEEFLAKLKLKAKVNFTPNPTFCGWNLCRKGIFKKPQLVLERLCIARETGNLANCLDSYAIEVSFAYSMGEELKLYLDDEGLDAHYQAVRFIVTHKHLLKSKIVTLFSNI